MQIKRISIDPLVQRNFNFAVGNPQMDKEAYSVSMVLAAVVRGLLGNSHGSSTMVIPAKALKEIAEQGAWLEIAEDNENLVVRTTLK